MRSRISLPSVVVLYDKEHSEIGSRYRAESSLRPKQNYCKSMCSGIDKFRLERINIENQLRLLLWIPHRVTESLELLFRGNLFGIVVRKQDKTCPKALPCQLWRFLQCECIIALPSQKQRTKTTSTSTYAPDQANVFVQSRKYMWHDCNVESCHGLWYD